MQRYHRRVPLTSLTLRARRRRRARIMLALVTLCILGLIAGMAYLIRAPFLRIQTVEVTGADPASDAQIKSFVLDKLAGNYHYFIPRNHVWEYSRLDLAHGILAAFPRFASAEPRLQSLTVLTITVSERLPNAMWCGETAGSDVPCQFLDQEGVAFAPAATTSTLAYVVYYGALNTSGVPAQYLSPPQFQKLSAFVSSIAGEGVSGPTTSVAVDAEGKVTVRFNNGFTMYFLLTDATDHAADLQERLGLAMQSAPFQENKISAFEYLDLRFGDSIYYKLKGTVSATGASTTSAH